MRVVPLVVSALLGGGCDAIFDLEHVDHRECFLDHDEDGDGLEDDCDPCPFDIDNAGDDDNDGIAQACDPDPARANQLLLFTGFDEVTRSSLVLTDGGYDGDSFHVMGTGSSQLIARLDPASVWVIAGVDVNRREGTGYAEIGFVFDAIATASSTQLNGFLCVLGYGGGEDYVETYRRDRPNNDSQTNHSPSQVPVATFKGIVRAAYTRDATPAAACSFASADNTEVAISGTPTPAQTPGDLALFTQDVDADVRFLLVTTKP